MRLDDPVRMYMNQMGKVPLLTREQEVEVFKRIEEAEWEMKRLVYGLGFAAKEHLAIAEKLLAEPPKERFDRIVVDKKVASREAHLQGPPRPGEKGPSAGCAGGRALCPLAEGRVPGPPPEALCRAPEAGEKAPGHLSRSSFTSQRCSRT